MDNKKPNNKEDEEKKRNKFIALIFLIPVIVAMFYPVISEKYETVPTVVYTLSKEQLEEYGRTTKAGSNDGMWESDDDTNSTTVVTISETTVPDSETSDNTKITVTFPLDINSASVEELMMVRGIGEITANKIVDYRGINGYFYSMDELLNVDGIGKKKLAALKGYLFIDVESLPETLPYFQDVSYYDNDDTVTVTTIPIQYADMTVTAVKSAITTEDFIMEIEEFVTGTDDELIAEDLDLRYSYSESSDLFEITETEYYPNFPLDLNSCDANDLTYIKGIGTSTANKIVEYAKTVGFTTVDDLLNVSGIGQSKLETIRPYVYVVSNGLITTAVNDIPDIFNEETSSQNETTTTYEIYKVNINSCEKNDLLQLPGIDESLADSILEFRNTIGYFKNIEELSFVITNEKLSEIWDYVYV